MRLSILTNYSAPRSLAALFHGDDGVGEGESTDSARKAFFIHGAMIKGRGRSALPKGLLGVRAAPP